MIVSDAAAYQKRTILQWYVEVDVSQDPVEPKESFVLRVIVIALDKSKDVALLNELSTG